MFTILLFTIIIFTTNIFILLYIGIAERVNEEAIDQIMNAKRFNNISFIHKYIYSFFLHINFVCEQNVNVEKERKE